MDVRRMFGNSGEKHAEKFLQKNGFKIVDRQYKTRFGEIDLIAMDGDEVVFIEVKTRRGIDFGYPEESVTQGKLQKIQKTAEIYMKKYPSAMPWRIDVISILQIKKEMQVVHLKSVY